MKNSKIILFSIISAVLILSLLSFTGFVMYKTRSSARTQYPLLLVHGHGQPMPIVTWEALKSKLVSEGYYIDKGTMTIRSFQQPNSWPKNSVVLITYYDPSPTEPIDTYAQRLSIIVNRILANTGANKVDIVAHSMGGLVSRAYIEKFGGASKVHELIMAGTPNYGITDLIGMGCPNVEPECKDMMVGSNFLQSLNMNNRGNAQYFTIAGDELGKGTDGIVLVSSVRLGCCQNYILNQYNHWSLISAPGTPNYEEYNKIISLLGLQKAGKITDLIKIGSISKLAVKPTISTLKTSK